MQAGRLPTWKRISPHTVSSGLRMSRLTRLVTRWLCGFAGIVILTACAAPSTTPPSVVGGATDVTLPTATVELPRPTPSVTLANATPTPQELGFDGDLAYEHVLAQMAFGPRVVGSEAHEQAGAYFLEQLALAGWETEEQPFEYEGVALRNFIARTNVGGGPVVIIGAHYDSRRLADQENPPSDQPVPGANDGASGVAVLLELARVLETDKLEYEVWLAFFDAEDDGGIDGWPWIIGSTYMAEHLTVEPEFVVVVDMIGDADQQIYLDMNSDPALSARIWALAGRLGYAQYFIPVPKHAMLDDHTPFAQKGITAVDIIDFDYPYWHTLSDTADKVSPQSRARVGETVEALLETR